MKKKILLIAALITLLLPGCSDIKPDSAADGNYATQNKESALEYSLYMGKQIQVFINEIGSRMAVADSITKGRKADNELSLATASLEKLRKVYDEAVTVNPSIGAEQDRENILKAMKTAIGHMEGYVDALTTNGKVEGYIADFQNDFNQLTGLANLYDH